MIDLSSLKGKTVRIAGATGLIGSHMARQATAAGAVVLKPGKRGFNFTSYSPEADITIHAAGYGQPTKFTKDPLETIQVNTELTIKLLDRQKPDGKFLFCSSSEVYSGLTGVVSEGEIGTTNPMHPRSCYIEGKRCGEAIINAVRSVGYDAKSARIALVYGPGTKKHDTRVLNQFIEQALTAGKIEMKYAGNEPRTYCYIDDAVDMLWQVLLYGKEAVYNIGGISETTAAILGLCISDLTKTKLFVPTKGGELSGSPSVVRMNLSRFENEFGKRQFTSLWNGLNQTIEFQRGLYGV